MECHSQPAAPRLRRAASALLAAALLLGAVASVPTGAQADESAGLRVVRDWAPDGVIEPQIVLDHDARRLYLVSTDSQGGIGVYDLDSLRPLAPVLPVMDLPSVQAMDELTPRGLLPVVLGYDVGLDAVLIGWRNEVPTVNDALVTAVGLRRGRLVEVGKLDVGQDLAPGARALAVTRPPGSSWMYVLTAGTASEPGSVALSQFHVSDFGGGRHPGGWVLPLPRCVRPLGADDTLTRTALGYLPEDRAVLFGCARAGETLLVDAPHPAGVARVVFDSEPAQVAPSRPTGIEVFTSRNATFVKGQSAFDGRSGRFVATNNAAGGSGVYYFDGPSTSWVGVQGAGVNGDPMQGIVVNQRTGRVYAAGTRESFADTVLYAGEARARSAPQGRFLKIAEDFIDVLSLAVDSHTDRVFLSRGDIGPQVVGGSRITIVKDDAPPFDIGEEDPDTNTHDIPEQPGVTGATFAGAAQGFGAVIRGQDPLNVKKNLVDFDHRVTLPTRELRTAWIEDVGVDQTAAKAAAVAADRDTDLRQTESQRPMGDQSPWPAPVKCIDSAGRPVEEGFSTATRVSCNFMGSFAEAVAVSGAVSAEGVSVARSSVVARVRRTSAEGTNVHVEATAEGIRIAGGDGLELLRIGSVSAVSDAWAHGRPGTARTTYSGAVLRDVVVHGTPVCGERCDKDAVARVVNEQLGGLVRLGFPKPDRRAAAGTPKGYQAEVRRDRNEHVEDVDLNGQPDERVEVPAMEIVVSYDGTRRWRTLVRLAGTEAEARYGIYPLGVEPPGGDDGGLVEAIEGPFGGADSGLIGGLLDATPVIEAAPDVELVAADQGGSALAQLLRVLRNPLRLFWNGDPLASAVLWALLLLPIYLSARRALLLRRAERLEVRTS